MIVTNQDSYVRGNTVLVPEYKPSRKIEQEKYEKLEKAKREAQKNKKQQILKQKMAVLRIILFAFVVGLCIIWRYSTIYGMEANFSKMKSQEANLKAENESLKMELIKNSNMGSIEEAAVNNLHMIKPNSTDNLSIDLSKNNFKPAQDSKSGTPMNILNKLREKLF